MLGRSPGPIPLGENNHPPGQDHKQPSWPASSESCSHSRERHGTAQHKKMSDTHTPLPSPNPTPRATKHPAPLDFYQLTKLFSPEDLKHPW